MKKSITQEAPYGCGIACFAFVAGITYNQAEEFLGEDQAKSNRFIIKHFREELNRYGLKYTSRHVRPDQRIEPVEGMIVLLRRSKQFPVGHYLAFYKGRWMDPYINLGYDQNFRKPESGFREVLPGQIMYVLMPE
ncbi:MAG TPA: hypothetical protein VFT59_05320 [Candidatus Saccharimonadales bacterium]|nr:hypothetical protein [Candidatus Saccharimonadales bacterium]